MNLVNLVDLYKNIDIIANPPFTMHVYNMIELVNISYVVSVVSVVCVVSVVYVVCVVCGAFTM